MLGALGQAALSAVLPARYAVVPLVVLLLRALVSTALAAAAPAKYASDLGVVAGRTTAQVPRTSYDPSRPGSASPFGSAPADQGVVVFHLGVRVTHPLGSLAPGFKDFQEHFKASNGDLLARATEYGCLGMTTWHSSDAASNNTIMSIYYFRDMEGLHRFAHDPAHRRAWDWFYTVFVKRWGYSHIGIFHEAFYAPPGNYETLYFNMPPALMGAASGQVRNEATAEDEWVGTLIDGSGPAWRTQYSRMGRTEEKTKKQML